MLSTSVSLFVRSACAFACIVGWGTVEAYAETALHHPVACSEARFQVGMNIPDKRDVRTGDVKSVEAIVLPA